jgi:hypothetical protein
MLVQLLAACGAGVAWIAGTDLAAILPAFETATLLPVLLQVAGHWLCLDVPKAVRMGPRAEESAPCVIVKTRKGLRTFARSPPRGLRARTVVVATLIFDFLGLAMLGGTEAARFKLLPKLGWLADSDFVLLVPLLVVPLVFSGFLIALGRHIDRARLAWWGQAIQALLAVLGRLVLVFALGAIFAGVLRAGGVENAASVIWAIEVALVYLAYIGLLLFLAPATSRFAAQQAILKN